MNTDTIQGNKLIAQFMGKTVYPILDTKEGPQWKGEKCDYHNFQLKYRESWDWLMPVVQKIESLQYDLGFGPVNFPVIIATDKVVIGEHYYSDFADITKDQPKIVATWLTVVDFIQWYNEQKINDISPHSEQ